MDFIFNPWVMSIIAMSLIIGNLLALKYLAKVKLKTLHKREDFEKLCQLDKKLQQMTAESDTDDIQSPIEAPQTPSNKTASSKKND